MPPLHPQNHVTGPQTKFHAYFQKLSAGIETGDPLEQRFTTIFLNMQIYYSLSIIWLDWFRHLLTKQYIQVGLQIHYMLYNF
jgi:hypothetical protein